MDSTHGTDTLVDLYGGVGLFTVLLGARRAEVVERSSSSVADARINTADLGARVTRSTVEAWTPSRADAVVADPPRQGLGAAGVAAVVATESERVALVSCDPAAMARDLSLLHDSGYVPTRIEVVDMFPHTHHIEAVTTLQSAGHARGRCALIRKLVAFVSLVISVAMLGLGAWLVFGRGNGSGVEADCATRSRPEPLGVEVVATHPHDPDAYTQGLLVDSEGQMWESTGLEGESQLRQVDPETGEVIESVDLPDDYFGEGLTESADGELVQLTWKAGRALRWEPDHVEAEWRFRIRGRGLGDQHPR